MKKFLINFVKKNRFLYNLAKWVNKKRNPNMFFKKKVDTKKYICYILNELEELEKIKNHYELIKNHNTILIVIVKNSKHNLQMHNLIEENPGINFIAYNYIEKYNKKISFRSSIFLDYNEKENLEIISNFI